MSKNYFKATKLTSLDDLKKGSKLPESDLTIQTDDKIVQFEFIENEDGGSKIPIKPGCFSIIKTAAGPNLEKLDLRKYNLLKTIDNTSAILKEADKFFNRLDVYKELKRDPKRAILLCSDPGIGKTAAINEVCQSFLKHKDTAVVVWDTSDVRSQTVSGFFLSGSEFSEKTKRMILVIEDIGGGSVDGYEGGVRGADSALLNLLDGVGSPFKGIPTFIIATTNNPETGVAALIDRPGRFDKVLTLKSPGSKECEDLLKFIQEVEELSDDDIEAARLSAKHKFSIAHIQETVVRSKLDDISVLEATKQLIEHKKRFENAFREIGRSIGLGT